MAPNITNSLDIDIKATYDSDQSLFIEKSQSFSYDDTIVTGVAYLPVANGSFDLPMPATTAYQLYIKNAHLTVEFNLAISAAQTVGFHTVMTMYPGDVFIIWAQPSTGRGNAGFVGVRILSAFGDTAIEYIIGA